VLAGKWADDRLGTLPLFAMTGFLIGMSAGWIAIYRLITRFLGRFD
jgi:F0F1-type ATP synthase assembly protein I